MYLRGTRHLSGYEFSGEENREHFRGVLEAAGLVEAVDPETPSLTVSVTTAYWRKANHIHKWFVDNVQNGVDECQEAYVAREQLVELRDLCKDLAARREADPEAARAVAGEKLPPQAGFFFGGTELDEWYWADVGSTVEQLDRVLALPDSLDFYYQSSW